MTESTREQRPLLRSARWLAPLVAIALSAAARHAGGAESAGPARGTLVVDGGGATDLVREPFVALCGGTDARVVVIPTGASAIRFGDDNIVLNPDWPRDRGEWSKYEA